MIFLAFVLKAVRLIGPAVPNAIRMLTDPAGPALFDDGLRYKEILSRHGVVVHLEQTSSSVENLNNLVETEVPTAAFV